MNEPTTLPEVIAYLTAKLTAGTNLSSGGESRPAEWPSEEPCARVKEAISTLERMRLSGAEKVAMGSQSALIRSKDTEHHEDTSSRSSALPAQNPLSQTQILHLLELGLANPSKQEDRR